MTEKDELLKLDNQLCFALYNASKNITKTYQPLLKRLDLTYTQYIALLVLWEKDEVTLSEIGARLNLDSGTLTPMLKAMESKDLLLRKKGVDDERKIFIKLTEKGKALKEEALKIPQEMMCKINLPKDKIFALRDLINKFNSKL
ncbi:MAG: Organic hydroperoxide resistance transcriptional regulator [Alphaproteobacteria bacterium ADurb.Bin438]|nr:MAG: Organic hydroperoxide resistance transcriptional regulator [Alphaproteobacteria bacterium ADurb.Bin438]